MVGPIVVTLHGSQREHSLKYSFSDCSSRVPPHWFFGGRCWSPASWLHSFRWSFPVFKQLAPWRISLRIHQTAADSTDLHRHPTEPSCTVKSACVW